MTDEPLADLELTAAEKDSGLWRKLKGYYEARLAHLRQLNDSRMPDAERAVLIGKIEEVKLFIQHDEDAPDVEPPPRMLTGNPERRSHGSLDGLIAR